MKKKIQNEPLVYTIQGKNLIISILLDRYKIVGKEQFGNPTAEWEYKVLSEALDDLGYIWPKEMFDKD